MAGDPRVLGLLEEMLSSGKAPEEVCRHCPELLPEVRRRWQQFQLVDAQVRSLLPGPGTSSEAGATTPPESVPVPPAAFGRYEVRGTLGAGGFGAVYLGHDTQLDRPVAIKVLHAKARPAQAGESALQEARRLAQLRHPGIVAVHDVGMHEGQVYIVSDYLDGPDLGRWLRDHRPAWPEAARIAAAVADALAHAHARLIIHRDVKPANILLGADRAPVLVDFGLALGEAQAGGAQKGVVAGTPYYMSPEQAAGTAHRIDGRTDVYSLGVVLYEMLTGRLPFRATDRQELLRQVRDDEPQPPRQLVGDIPPELGRACLKALAKRQEDRYFTAGDFAAVLRRVLSMGAEVQDSQPMPAEASDELPQGDPPIIGRYRIVRRLGQGGFGRVYLARDDDLDRPVAIKVPSPGCVSGPDDVERYLREARALARLDHPRIVPVHDVGYTEDGLCYVVSKYVEGSDLAERKRQGRWPFRESAELVAVVAEALHHAHTRGVVHRDIKPANILIDLQGRPWVADFGLALRDHDCGKEDKLVGTPAYMSPEQARGEGHRVDGRSDIFSLGVVFYELLTGRKPFRGDTHAQVLEQILRTEERPPRQIDVTIPRELERICQRMLAKRASERYSTARDLADDLWHFLRDGAASGLPATAPARPDSDGLVLKVIPKGLRSFDRNDADFFLGLLPGPRDRDGLPESLRFWKTRIESTDPDATFKVGLIYGPSGCGKSSLVKAGLLPRLGRDVRAVYIEATPEETEARLLRGLRKACPDLPANHTLVDAMAALRRGRVVRPGEKALLVLDQFEQWLLARRGEADIELVAGLRQCDGEYVQAIVMVRDDFWMAAIRFMRDLEIDLVPDQNIAVVDLFDLRHARKVLAAFGQAYGTLPERTSERSRDQESFLDRAIAGLAQDGRIISVRLALFAEMVKGKPWTPATLREVGGTEGVGLTFLEETFSSPQANPKHRLHQKAAQAVLKALLPQTGTDIKGQMRSEEELRAASGYADRPLDFDDLIAILDHDLRLITPADPERSTGEVSSARTGTERCYQLTHDYLVHSLRDWLTRKQRETRRGRAELRLADRAALWSAKPENRRLPSVLEWANIRLLTKKSEWTQPQEQMMRRAGRVHGLRGMNLAILIALASWGGIEGYGALRASALVESLETASTIGVPGLVEELRTYRRWAGRPLARLLSSTPKDSDPHLRASLARLALWPDDERQAGYLYDRLLRASPVDLPVIWGILKKHHQGIDQRLWSLLDDPKSDPEKRFHAACALANAGSAAVENRWESVSPFITDRFLAAAVRNPGIYATLIETLRPLRKRLLAPLSSIFRDTGRSESERSFATTILADYASDDPDVLAELLMTASHKAYVSLFPAVERQAARALPAFQAEIAKGPITGEDGPSSEQRKDSLAERQARAAVALIRLGHADLVWPLLHHSADPRLRSFIVNWLNPLGADPKILTAEFIRLDSPPRPAERGGGGRGPGEGSSAPFATRKMDEILFHPETSTRRALILSGLSQNPPRLIADRGQFPSGRVQSWA